MKKRSGLRRATALFMAFTLVFTSCFVIGAEEIGASQGVDAAVDMFTAPSEGGGENMLAGAPGDIANMATATGMDSDAFSGGGEPAQPQPEAQPEPVNTFTVAGNVNTFDQQGQNPAAFAGLTVQLYSSAAYLAEGENLPLQEVHTDENGRYEFQNVEAGVYRVEFRSTDENFDPAGYEVVQPAAAAQEGKPYFAYLEGVDTAIAQEWNLSLNTKAPETPETTEGSEAPETTPEETPEEPGTDVTDTPDATDTPEVTDPEPTPGETPETPEEPGTDVTDTPDVTDKPEVTDPEPTPGETPEAPVEPETPETTPEPPVVQEVAPETEMLVEVLADEVNLRTTPFVAEDNVAAVAYAGERYPLLASAQAGEELWYKISFMDPESGEAAALYVSNAFAQLVEVEPTEEPEPTPTEPVPTEPPVEEELTDGEEQSESEEPVEETVTYTYEDSEVVVSAAAAAGVFPENARLNVTAIPAGTVEYEDVEARLQEKAAQEDYAIAGFLAYDITFTADVNGEVQTIEPNSELGNVKVTIEYKEAASESPEADVTVMHLEENAEGQVVDVVDMGQNGQLQNVDTTEAQEVKAVEFETESFSTYTVVWKDNNEKVKTLYIEYVDENGEALPETIVPEEKQELSFGYSDTKTVDLTEKPYYIDLTKKGYEYQGTYLDMSKRTEVARVRVEKKYAWFGGTSYSMEYNSRQSGSTGWEEVDGDSLTVYMIYKGNAEISIVDHIKENGTLVPVLGGSLKNEIQNVEAEPAHYVWYKSVNGGDFKEVALSKSGQDYNLAEDGAWLNVPLDDGALGADQRSVEYKVSVFVGDEKEPRATSEAFAIPYWNELQNGSFEIPQYQPGSVVTNSSDVMYQSSNEQYKRAGGVWQTTGVKGGQDIEILNPSHSYKGFEDAFWWDGRNIPDGKQFAELNCEAEGALYQDVLTIPGQTLNYQLSHRARGNDHKTIRESIPEFDTMYVVIIPTKDAEHITNQNALKAFLQSKGVTLDTENENEVMDKVVYNDDGILVHKISSNDQNWHTVTNNGSYKSTESLTRFFFLAGPTAYKGNLENTVGNFLDKVWFSQELPPAEPGEFQLQVRKTVEGLDEEAIQELEDRLTFNIESDSTAPYNGYNFKLEDMEQKSSEDGLYVYEKMISAPMEAYESHKYSVTETDEKMPGYDVETKLEITGGEVDKKEQTTIIKERTSATFDFTNTYSVNGEITIYKTDSNGTGLGGAVFQLVNDKNPKDSWEKTSEADGTVTFDKLKLGTYTLTETKAPEGYVLEPNSGWKVVVTLNETTEEPVIETKLYLADGTTPVEDNTIKNYTQQEVAERNLTNTKSARVIDEDKRIYEINLGAEVTGRQEGVEAKAASIVLVLDASDSMNNKIYDPDTREYVTKLASTKEAAKKFVQTAAAQTPISEIAVVWYSGTEGSSGNLTSVHEFTQLDSEMNIQGLESFIENRRAGGGTPMGAALAKANELLSGNTKPNPKYVLFFTDGMPGHQTGRDNWNCQVANKAYNMAKEIKEYAELYTIGCALDGFFQWSPGHADDSAEDKDHKGHSSTSASGFLSKYIASQPQGDKNYAFTADNAEQLSQIFEGIAGQIGELFSVNAEKIVDVIDSRFELTEASEKMLKEIYRNGVSIEKNEDGTTTITWSDEAAVIRNKEAEDPGWNVQFRIQAKEDFIGGNMIPTNGSASGIYLDGDGEVDKPFPQPSVNVKLLDFGLTDRNATVYKGDVVSPMDFAEDMFATLKIGRNNDGTITEPEGMEKPSWPLTEEQKEQLAAEGRLELGGDTEDFQYAYPGTTDPIGYFRYIYEAVAPENTVVTEHVATTEGTDVEKYKLTVQYTPYTKETRIASLPGIINPPAAENGGKPVTTITAEATCKLSVIAGEIQIEKILAKSEETDRTFAFRVERVMPDGGSEIIAKPEITVKAGTTNAEYISAELNPLDSLPRGTYVVSEVVGNDYDVQSMSVIDGSTNCQSSISQEPLIATFILGNARNGQDVIEDYNYNPENGGVLGAVSFTNEKVFKNWNIVKRSSSDDRLTLSGAEFSLTSSEHAYVGKSGEDGVVSWYEGDGKIPVEKLQKGTYTLKETKAPNGYRLSDETWSLVINAKGYLIETDAEEFESVTDNDGTTVMQYYYENEAVYALPSTGGTGIYVYMISGILLMMAAALILYKKRTL